MKRQEFEIQKLIKLKMTYELKDFFHLLQKTFDFYI